ncbi:MoxR family ATPase [Saxibacter everestensis]|uniref:MoxR family ATPase n=2 Tax=Saxibacter everestensis TaxID=2909229 RepID=A0ABY8QYB6_9MICO|nr:MoxR family ATPase [Brevibacteriaceae bacterium ZFBP1038]
MQAMSTVLEGKAEALRMAWTIVLAEGHLLIEDVPGVGKTLLAKALGKVVGGTVKRVQFTPDLLPSDVVGVNMFNQEQHRFEFRPGPVFASIVIGDEINRASPKTQSALLECMAERQASIDGVTHELPNPFMVVATQNPVDMEGTYSLPEAQRDRFMAKISIGYPAQDAETDLLANHAGKDPLKSMQPVCSIDKLRRAIQTVHSVTATDALRDYIVRLLAATRDPSRFSLGASPRAGIHLLRASRARAVLEGRDFVLPDDVQALAQPVLAHRLIPSRDRQSGASSVHTTLQEILASVPVSAERRSPELAVAQLATPTGRGRRAPIRSAGE